MKFKREIFFLGHRPIPKNSTTISATYRILIPPEKTWLSPAPAHLSLEEIFQGGFLDRDLDLNTSIKPSLNPGQPPNLSKQNDSKNSTTQRAHLIPKHRLKAGPDEKRLVKLIFMLMDLILGLVNFGVGQNSGLFIRPVSHRLLSGLHP